MNKIMKLIGTIIILSFVMSFSITMVSAEDDGIVILDHGEEAPSQMSLFEWFIVLSLTSTVGFSAYTAWKTRGDEGAADSIKDVQDNRSLMQKYEQGYKSSNGKIQFAFDNLTEFLIFADSITVLKSVEALANLAKDIQEPGPPSETVPSEALGEANPTK